MNKKLKWFLIIVVSIVVIILLVKGLGGNNNEGTKVSTEKVVRKTIIETVTAILQISQQMVKHVGMFL